MFRHTTLVAVAAVATLLSIPSTAFAATTAPTWWKPIKGLTWQWQLSGKTDLTVNAAVYDLDAGETPASTVTALHNVGRKAVCYVDVGSYENGRSDAAKVPTAVIGKTMDGWPDEKWLDIRRWTVLKPIMQARMNACKTKGFDGVEPDNVDGYTNETGFPLTGNDQLTYNKNIAELAHSLGLAVGLKNDIDQVKALAPNFDFATNEQCVQYNECGNLSAFTVANKPVFHVEYSLDTSKFCPTARKLGFSSMHKHLSLDAWRQPC
jgi:hypothetical protein